MQRVIVGGGARRRCERAVVLRSRALFVYMGTGASQVRV